MNIRRLMTVMALFSTAFIRAEEEGVEEVIAQEYSSIEAVVVSEDITLECSTEESCLESELATYPMDVESVVVDEIVFEEEPLSVPNEECACSEADNVLIEATEEAAVEEAALEDETPSDLCPYHECASLTESATQETLEVSPVDTEKDTVCVINIQEMDEETLVAFFAGYIDNAILQVSKEDPFPVEFVLTGDYLEFSLQSANNLQVQLKKDLYIQVSPDGDILFSSDLNSWRDFSSFFTGEIGLQISFDNGAGCITLSAELSEIQP